MDHNQLSNDVQQWLSALCHYVDSLDALMAEQINTTHLRLVHWMIQVLIRLAPDQEYISDEARESIYKSSDSIENLILNSNELKSNLEELTKSLVE